MGLLGQRKRDWRIVYAPCSGKTKFYNDEESAARYSEGMDKRTALKYLGLFYDAVYIEKIKGFRAGRRISKKR